MDTQKEYYSIDEVAQQLSRHKATIWDRVRVLGIETYKFKRDRKTYVSAGDVERIRAVLSEKPWLAGKDTKEKREPAA